MNKQEAFDFLVKFQTILRMRCRVWRDNFFRLFLFGGAFGCVASGWLRKDFFAASRRNEFLSDAPEIDFRLRFAST